MKHLSVRNGIPMLEWQRVTTIAWSVLSLIFGVQALLSSLPIQSWQIFYVIGLASTLLISLSLSKRIQSALNSTPVILYLLVSPIIIGDRAKSPWMSIGLVTFAAVIYYATINNVYLACFTVVLVTFYQTFIAQLSLKSVSDNFDIAYFNSYFSILYTIIFGFASIYIHRKYLRVANQVEDIVTSKMRNSILRLEELKRINVKDSRNLQLHGTVLNTLIHYRNLIIQKRDYSQIHQNLTQEINSLESTFQETESRSFDSKLNELLLTRSLNRIKITHSSFKQDIQSEFAEKSCLEIIRELILNTEKHTNATAGKLSVSLHPNREIRIYFQFDNPERSIKASDENIIQLGPSSSRTLNKLLVSCGSSLKFSPTGENGLSEVEISIPLINQASELQKTLSSARTHGLNDFTLNYVRAGVLVAILSFPGYLLVGLNLYALLLNFALILSITYLLQIGPNILVSAVMVFSSLLIIPAVSHNVSSCTQVLSIPWLFNHVLTVCFFTAVQFKGQVLKWVPTIILSAECIFFPSFFPPGCKNIFLGSLPGIPLIIVLAFAVLGVRKRELVFDEEDSIAISETLTISSEVDRYREITYQELISDCSAIMIQLNESSSSESRLIRISILIQMIQTYLICSEHFESNLIRKLFEIFRECQRSGIPGRITLLGAKFTSIVGDDLIEKIALGIKEIKGSTPADVTLVHLDNLEIYIDGIAPTLLISSLAGVPVKFNP